MGDAGSAGARRCTADTTLVRAPASLERRTGSSVVVLGDTVPIVLRGTGVAIWDAFTVAQTVETAAVQLGAQYGSSPELVQREMLPVLEGLVAAGALTIVHQVPC